MHFSLMQPKTDPKEPAAGLQESGPTKTKQQRSLELGVGKLASAQYDANICGAAASVGFCKDAVVAAVCAGTCKTNAKIDLCTVDHCDSTNSKFVNQT